MNREEAHPMRCVSKWLRCGHCETSTLRAAAEADSGDDSMRCAGCGAHLGFRKTPAGKFGGQDRKRLAAGER